MMAGIPASQAAFRMKLLRVLRMVVNSGFKSISTIPLRMKGLFGIVKIPASGNHSDPAHMRHF
jgi:hypothetical protein